MTVDFIQNFIGKYSIYFTKERSYHLMLYTGAVSVLYFKMAVKHFTINEAHRLLKKKLYSACCWC